MRVVLVLCGIICALCGCSTDRSFTPLMPEAYQISEIYQVFTGTSRALNENGSFGAERSEKLQYLELDVGVPPSHTPGELSFGYGNADPNTDFVVANRQIFEGKRSFQSALRRELSQRAPVDRNISLFIHGYNATQIETAYRAAQMSHDLGFKDVRAIYSWPSRGKAFGYVYDSDSLLFARDSLEKFIRDIKEIEPRRFLIVAHSMGAMLLMETLRQIDLIEPGWPAKHIDAVVLMSPDVDVDVFRVQASRMSELPQPIVVFSSSKDQALNISAFLRGTQDRGRLGNIENINSLKGVPIEIVDVTAFNSNAVSSHLTAVTSPETLKILGDIRDSFEIWDSEDASLTGVLSGSVTQVGDTVEIALSKSGER